MLDGYKRFLRFRCEALGESNPPWKLPSFEASVFDCLKGFTFIPSKTDMKKLLFVSLLALLAVDACAPYYAGPPAPPPPPGPVVGGVTVAVEDQPYYVHGPYYYVRGQRWVWVHGHWAWRHGRRVWVHGRYVVRP